MKSEITLYRYTLEKLIESYDSLVKQINSPEDRAFILGKRCAFEYLLTLFCDDMSLSDLHREAFTPSDES